MALLKVLIGIILIGIVLGGSYYLYEEYLSGEIQDLNLLNYNSKPEINISDAKPGLQQFYQNMRFNHNEISYYINPECSSEKELKMKEAFNFVEDETEILSFYSDFEDNADIVIGCSKDSYEKEENVFVGGEGGPTRIINSSMSVILRGKILLYDEDRSKCDRPLLELHELFHVFGYEHINDENDLMYPYLDCDQEINPDLIQDLFRLYSIEPTAELYFGEANAYKERFAGKWYLNFNITVDNQGIIDAENVQLEVKADDNLVETFDFNDIVLGGGEKFYVKNLLLPSSNNVIKLELSTSTKESSLSNNIMTVE